MQPRGGDVEDALRNDLAERGYDDDFGHQLSNCLGKIFGADLFRLEQHQAGSGGGLFDRRRGHFAAAPRGPVRLRDDGDDVIRRRSDQPVQGRNGER